MRGFRWSALALSSALAMGAIVASRDARADSPPDAPSSAPPARSATAPRGTPAPARASGPRTPGQLLGLGPMLTAGPTNVTLLVNTGEIRKHPVGAQLGPLVAAAPQWASVLQGAGASSFDPVTGLDWVLVYGPSLVHTDRDIVFVRHGASDADADAAIDALARGSLSGGPFDTGVAGVHAAKATVDHGERVVMRLKRGVVVASPPDKAAELARTYKTAAFSAHVRPAEAFRIIMKEPWRVLPALPQSIAESRAWLDLHDQDGSADLFAELDCDTPEHAAALATELREALRKQNAQMMVRIITRGLLSTAEVEVLGSRVTLHVPASRDQLEGILGLLAAQLGVTLQPSAPSAPPGPSSP